MNPNRVEWLSYRKWRVAEFDSPGEAYRFWLALKQGILALLYQNGKLVGQGR
jgi:hypothetical protein